MLRMGCEQVDELKRRFALVRAARAAAELEVGAQTEGGWGRGIVGVWGAQIA